MTSHKSLSIILPSFNDLRILRAIESIRRFDDVNIVKIVIIDGGSTSNIIQSIKPLLTESDIFVSESDRGIFDALNKGLGICDTEFIGWLGSDDVFTGLVPSSEVINVLKKYDLLVADLYFFHNEYITRKTSAWPSKFGLMNFGLHNPHFATFGRSKLLKSEAFKLSLNASDIEYFIKIYNKKPRIKTLNKVSTLQAEGGFSNGSIRSMINLNIECFSIFSKNTNGFIGLLAVFNKIGLKLLYKIYFSMWRKKIDIFILKPLNHK